MEPRLMSAVIIAGIFGLYMIISLATFWRQLDDMRDRSEKQDKLKGRYSGYRGLSGLTAMLGNNKGRRRMTKRHI